MQYKSVPTLPTPILHPGSIVGPWKVVTWAGGGVYGVVYRAVSVDSEQAPPVALKLARNPRDPRFVREAELLSRTHHPSIPRLMGSGSWQSPDGALHPFVAMEWIGGLPLYTWAQQHLPTESQVLKLLAQLAGALAALHAQGGVHRDVKGYNVLVRESDGRAMLTDFGTGYYSGADTLTPPGVYPGTPAYGSPESRLLALQSHPGRSARYVAGPADDVYALGVTACRLITWHYPKLEEPWQDVHGTWHLDRVIVPPLLLHTEPRLRDPVLRMLSVHPEERGTAAELAEALEQAFASSSSQKAPSPPAQRTAAARRPASPAASRQRVSRRRTTWPLLWVTATGLVLGTATGWCDRRLRFAEQSFTRAELMKRRQKDKGTAALGEAAASLSSDVHHDLSAQEAMAQDTLPEPIPGQVVPDAKGRCPLKQQVALNGGCWVPLIQESEVCEALDGQVFKGTCYIPSIERPHKRPRPRTSGPTRHSAPR